MTQSPVLERPLEIDEFVSMPEFDGFELIDGCPRERNVSRQSTRAGMSFGSALYVFFAVDDRADVYNSEQGFALWPDRPQMFRKPDVAVILRERAPEGDPGVITVAPDMVVEAVSPGDALSDVRDKVDLWHAGGVRLVWVALPHTREIQVYRSDEHPVILTADDEVTLNGIIDGFRRVVSDLFPPRA